MTQQRAAKIAANLVRQFGRERFFSLSLPSFQDLDQIASMLREDHACTVVYNLQRSKISVHCPQSTSSMVSSIDLLEKEVVKMSG
jgi:hypothetical protein